jgi:hypothetical protein
MRKDVAWFWIALGMSSLGKFRLTPIPTTTKTTPSASQQDSVRIPAIFFPPTRISFGHLISGGEGRKERMVSAKATPDIKVICGVQLGGSVGRKIKER